MEKMHSGVSVGDLLRSAKDDIAKSSLSSAEKTLEQVILLNNQLPEAFHLLGYVFLKKGKFNKAILSYKKTLALDPFHTEAAIALSGLHNDMGQYREASEVFQKTKKRLDRAMPGYDPKINQQLAERHHELGAQYLQYERFLEAHHEFSKAVNLNPDRVESIILMAKCLSRSGDKEKAVSILKRAVESHPSHSEARVQLGILYYSIQKIQEAKWEWQEALALDPDNRHAQMFMSMVDLTATA